MNDFSVMVVPDSGQVMNYRVTQRTLKIAVTSLVLLICFGLWGAYSLYSSMNMSAQLEAANKQLQETSTQYEKAKLLLQQDMSAEKNKMAVYAREIGQMQAQLSRLDSLGERLVETASLDKAGFDFGLKPALGGPRLVPVSVPVQLDLDDHLQQVDNQLAHLDTQLVAINYLLQGEREESVAKPHAWPSEGGWLSSHYGIRTDPFTGERAMHRGIDIANRLGSAVLAGSRGIVIFAGKIKDYGYMVEIEHGYGYRTRYGHMSSLAVKAGDEVIDNQMVGRVGSSGRSTGPHLHYEIHRFGKVMNPAKFLPRG
ncbi:MAG: M23 family metallopeptidase [Mariprofundaceae bacterium]